MKAVSHPGKTKQGTPSRNGKNRAPQGLFLGYKALHELRILMRIASSPSVTDSKSEKSSY